MYQHEIDLSEYGKPFDFVRGGTITTIEGGGKVIFSTKKSQASIKGYIKNLDTGEVKAFQYNPSESFDYSRGATYASIESPGQQYPTTTFVKGNLRTFSIDLMLFDKPYTGLIDTNYMLFFGKLLTPESNSPDYRKPPQFVFSYGYFVRTCVLEDLKISIQEWDEYLRPVKAIVTLQIRQL